MDAIQVYLVTGSLGKSEMLLFSNFVFASVLSGSRNGNMKESMEKLVEQKGKFVSIDSMQRILPGFVFCYLQGLEA